MLQKVKDWFGIGGIDEFNGHAADGGGSHHDGHGDGGHDHPHHGHGGAHGHTHGIIDASITATERGVWAVKWSFVILAITAALQFIVVLLSGSVLYLFATPELRLRFRES